MSATGRAAANSSAVVALGGAALSVGNTVVPPTARTALQFTLKSLQRASPGAADIRRDVQAALETLKNLPPGASAASAASAQADAHAALVRYGQSKASYADALLPIVHKATFVGVAGAGMAFGAGRSSGVALADTILRERRGDDASLGLRAAPIAPGRTGADATVDAVAQATLGAALGGVGNFVGQTVVAPLVNRINKQLTPVDPKAVVPDAMVAHMEQIHPGSGQALRKSVTDEQGRNQNISSERNVAIGQFFFDAANATRAAVQEPNTLGLAGNALAGTAASASAGAAIGATIAINSSLAKAKVPDMAALAAASAAGASGAAALAALPQHEVPLFYTRRVPVAEAKIFANPVADPIPRAAAQTSVPLGNAPAAPAPSPSAVSSAINMATSMAMRGVAMLKATVGTAVINAMAPTFAASMPTEAGATAARAAAAAIGIHTVIKPWFGELAGGIAGRDAAIMAARQTAVDAAAQRRIATAAAAPAPAPAPVAAAPAAAAPAPAAPAPAAAPTTNPAPGVIELATLGRPSAPNPSVSRPAPGHPATGAP